MNWYKFARFMNNLDAVMKPTRLPRRTKNIALGKMLNKSGVFRKLWK